MRPSVTEPTQSSPSTTGSWERPQVLSRLSAWRTLPEGPTETSGGTSSGCRRSSSPAVTRSAAIIWFSRIQVSS